MKAERSKFDREQSGWTIEVRYQTIDRKGRMFERKTWMIDATLAASMGKPERLMIVHTIKFSHLSPYEHAWSLYICYFHHLPHFGHPLASINPRVSVRVRFGGRRSSLGFHLREEVTSLLKSCSCTVLSLIYYCLVNA